MDVTQESRSTQRLDLDAISELSIPQIREYVRHRAVEHLSSRDCEMIFDIAIEKRDPNDPTHDEFIDVLYEAINRMRQAAALI